MRTGFGWLLLVVACSAGCEFDDDGVSTVIGDPRERTTTPGQMGGDGPSSDGALACDLREINGQCRDLVGPEWAQDVDLSQRTCESENGTFRQDWRCPSDDSIGTCSLSFGQNAIDLTYYVGDIYSIYDAPDLEAACSLDGGAWVPAP